jgi:hypothetical protein
LTSARRAPNVVRAAGTGRHSVRRFRRPEASAIADNHQRRFSILDWVFLAENAEESAG